MRIIRTVVLSFSALVVGLAPACDAPPADGVGEGW